MRGHRIAAATVILAAIVLVSCASPEPATYEGEYLFVDHLQEAVAISESPKPLTAPHWAIGFDERRVIFQHPPARYRYRAVPSVAGATFKAAPSLSPKAWETQTDGVGFEVRCRAEDGSWQSLLSVVVTAAVEDRKWHDSAAPLEACSQPETEIELITTCGPEGRCAGDWAIWGRPRVEYPQVFEPRFERLVVLISIDTLRPDRLGVYGAERDTSPELERLAADGVVFETAVASAPWTIPSHATLLTSTDPLVHGADANNAVSASVPLLAEILGEEGWQSAGFVDTAFLGEKFGFHRGFDHFDDDSPPQGDYRRGVRVTRQRALDWLETADERPAFLFWHIMDVHGPYWSSAPFAGKFREGLPPPEDSDRRLDHLQDLKYHKYLNLDRYASFDELLASYDEGIASVDAAIGSLLDGLRAAGVYDDALIIVTSDHGESFLDHDVWVGHGIFLTDDEIRVPLIVKLPGNRHAGLRVEEMVGLIDVAPSVLDVLGVAPPESFGGRSLVSPEPGVSESLPEAVFGVSSNTGATFVRTESFKYIAATRTGPEKILELHLKARRGVELDLDRLAGEQLYHLRRDPGEMTSLVDSEEPEEIVRFRELLERHAAASAAVAEGTESEAPPELTAEDEERLRALGYLN